MAKYAVQAALRIIIKYGYTKYIYIYTSVGYDTHAIYIYADRLIHLAWQIHTHIQIYNGNGMTE